MNESELIENLAEALAKKINTKIPFDVALWDSETVATYFNKSPAVARRSILCLPSFPKAVRTDRTAHPQYFANEVVDWAKTRKDRH